MATARRRIAKSLDLMDKEIFVAALYNNNYKDCDIAELLGIETRTVERTRCNMGLAPRWGSKGGHTFTPEEDALILRRKEQEHITFFSISQEIGISPTLTQNRYELLVRLRSQKNAHKKKEKINCIRCRNLFVSEDRKKVRYCSHCRKIINGLTSSYDV